MEFLTLYRILLDDEGDYTLSPIHVNENAISHVEDVEDGLIFYDHDDVETTAVKVTFNSGDYFTVLDFLGGDDASNI